MMPCAKIYTRSSKQRCSMAGDRGHKAIRAAIYALLITLIVCSIAWSEVLKREHYKTEPVKSLKVNISGGGEHPLADVESIDLWIREHGLFTEGLTLDKVQVSDMEHTAISHNAVANANAYTDYRGHAVLDVELRTPIARLRIDGYDHYITEDGFILPTVKDCTAAVPVITGSYTPLFTPDYSGYAAEVVTDSLASLDKLIASLEDAKMPYYRQLDSNDRELREVLSQGVRKGIFMSDSEYEILIGAREATKVAARERHTAKKREIEAAIAALTLAQQEARLKQRDVQKAGDDFNALLKLLKSVERSRFWSAEIVQIILKGGGKENMEVGFVPRSGNFIVDLGTATDIDTKLANLYRFYNKGLDKMGWDKHKSISLRYHGQVVCR